MTTRTFRLKAVGYADSDVTIQAKIDGTTVYSGPIFTIDQYPLLPDRNIHLGEPIFIWTGDVNFAGSFDLELTMSNPADFQGWMYICDIDANYIGIDNPDSPGNLISGGANVFGQCFWQTHSDEQGEWICGQSLEDITVDGIATEQHGTREWPGQPYINLSPSQTATAVIRVNAGIL